MPIMYLKEKLKFLPTIKKIYWFIGLYIVGVLIMAVVSFFSHFLIYLLSNLQNIF